MIRRIAIAIALLAIASSALAVGRTEVLITPEGTVHSIDTTIVDETTIPIQTEITLYTQKGSEFTTVAVPGSSDGSLNVLPSIAWDDESETLFVFWLSIHSLASSELNVAWVHDGVWSEVSTIEGGHFHYRSNLHVETTHLVTTVHEDGTRTTKPGLRLHAVWWDEDGRTSAARYALLTIEDGSLGSIEIATLPDLLPESSDYFETPSANPYQFQHPTLHRNPSGDGVSIVFSNLDRNTMEIVDVLPMADGVLTIPDGIRARPGSRRLPVFETAESYVSQRVILSEQSRDRVLAYVVDGPTIRFSQWDGSAWAAEQMVVLSERVDVDAAIAALDRLIDSTRPSGVLTIPDGNR